MTITVSPVYEKGKTYQMTVLFDSVEVKSKERYLNVWQKADGKSFKVEVPTPPVGGKQSLKDKTVDLVCTEVTEKGPEFALAEKYFQWPEPPVVRGANLGISESEKIEFKKSLIYSPVSHQPNDDQPFEIAKQVAAMMNTNGGTLYLGVNDDGYVTGVEHDFPVLENAAICMNSRTDAGWTYAPNLDGYQRKFNTAVLLYLGANAAARLNGNIDVKTDEQTQLHYLAVRIPESDEIVYLGREEHFVFRVGASVQYLAGRERDQYAKNRFILRGEKSAQDALKKFREENASLKNQLAQAEEEKAKLLEKGDAKAVDKMIDHEIVNYGKKPKFEKEAGFRLEKNILDGIENPAGILYKAGELGQRLFYCENGKTWANAYEELLKLCAERDQIKFEQLPDNDEFCKPRQKNMPPYFVRKGPRKSLKNPSSYLGPNADVRADLRCGTKLAFSDEKSLPRRLMAYFGIDAKDVRIWNGR